MAFTLLLWEALWSTRKKMDDKKSVVLVVDDDENNLALLSTVLAKEYQVLTLSDPFLTTSFIRKQFVDVILLDVIMPEIHGFELAKQLRKQWGRDELPIIFVSAKESRDDLLNGLRVGANDFIIKPFKIDNLLERIDTILLETQQSRKSRLLSGHDTKYKVLYISKEHPHKKTLTQHLEARNVSLEIFEDPLHALCFFAKFDQFVDVIILEDGDDPHAIHPMFSYFTHVNGQIPIVLLSDNEKSDQDPAILHRAPRNSSMTDLESLVLRYLPERISSRG